MRPTRATARGETPRDELLIVVTNEQGPGAPEVDETRWAALAEAALVDRNIVSGELNVLYIDEAAMADLHEQHMGGHEPTDVLSFPIDADDFQPPGSGPALLGDVVICPTFAQRQAAENKVSYDDELALLLVHGILHILGMDHAEPDEAAEMQATEKDLLSRLHSVTP